MIKIILTVALFVSQINVIASTLDATVLSIQDGDTIIIKALSENKKQKLRLVGIDTPETDYQGHSQGEASSLAKFFLANLLPIGSKVQIKFGKNTTDVNNRLLGHVFYNGIDVNLRMLESGFAYFYFIYPFDKTYMASYSKASLYAIENELGLFNKKFGQIEEPYLFRQRIQGQEGTYLVGNAETKTLYSQIDIVLVPMNVRVFFPDFESAKKMGYTFSN